MVARSPLREAHSFHLGISIEAQPDDSSCGPTCLHAVYRHFGDSISLATVIDEVHRLDTGGTLSVHLANHALARGYQATVYTYNLQLFDPTWFLKGADIADKIRRRQAARPDSRHRAAAAGYLPFLEAGGTLRYEELTPSLIRSCLLQGIPMITGLSATHLHSMVREMPDGEENDVLGDPVGHFVLIHGIDLDHATLDIADPYLHTPKPNGHYYAVPIGRVLTSVALGIITWDANLLVIEPSE